MSARDVSVTGLLSAWWARDEFGWVHLAGGYLMWVGERQGGSEHRGCVAKVNHYVAWQCCERHVACSLW